MDKLKEVFTNRSICARGEVVKSPIPVAKAEDVRDALAKRIYGNIFVSIVSKINETVSQPRVRIQRISLIFFSFVTQTLKLRLFSSGQ